MARYICTITEGDIPPNNRNKNVRHRIAISRALGRVLPRDVGKRVYNVGTRICPVYQVENDHQLADRLEKEAAK